MVKFLIHRPVAVTMAFLAFLLIGIATTTNLPVSLMPDIDIPVVSIRISSSELPARQLENTVVKTVRNLLKEVNHVEELKSETRDGSAWIELRFRHGTPIDLASVEVNEKVDKAMNFLPREMKRPEVIRASASDIPVFYLMINQKQLSSPSSTPPSGGSGGAGNSPNPAEISNLRSSTSPLRGDRGGLGAGGASLSLSNFSSQVIRKRLEQLPEVALVDMSGLQHPEIKITPNKTFLQNGSFSVAQLEEVLQNNNIDLGNLLIRDGQYQYNIRFNTRLRDVSDIENVPVNLNGKVVKLKELAEINLQSQKPQGNINFNSNPAISLAVIKQSDAKMADLEKELDFLISRFREDYPNLEFSVTRDQSKLLKYSISNLGQSLIIGGLLAFLTMFVFLRERKAPWLIGISIPVSLIISLLLFYLTGLSINIISLSGLILGVGMMIDNSIIVIDNITQHRERNQAKAKAEKKAEAKFQFSVQTSNQQPVTSNRQTTETSPTLEPSNLQTSPNLQTSSNPQTLKPSSTSSPLDLLSKSCEDGTNEIISPLISSVLTTCAVFIPLIFMKGMAGALFFDQAVAVTIGLTVSLIVSITLLPTLYRLIYRKNSNDKAPKKKLPIYFHWYESGLKFVFRHQFLTVFSVLIMLVLLVFMWKWLPVSRFPKMSLDETILKIDWNEPVTLEENNARIIELIVGISARPEYIIEEAGRQQYFLNSIGEAGTSENNLFIKCASPQKLKELTSEVTGLIQKSYPHADFSFSETENLFNLAFGKSDAPLIARVTHFNPGGENYLTELAELQKELEQKFGDKITSRIITRNLILLETDPEKLLYYQVDNTDLYREIKSAFNVNTVFTINDNNLYVPVSVGNDFQSVYEIVQNITIRNKNNERIPLSGLVKINSGSDLKTIVAGRESEYFPVLFEIEPNAYKKTTQEIKTIIGNNQNYDVTFGGSILSNRGMLLELLLIVGVSLLLLYFILAAQFESFVLPLIVLLEVPIDLFGVFLFLKLFGAGINIMSAIGIIVMTGIIINDSILKIDTINKLMEAGNSLIRSIFEAGRRRLKPILMTSLTTILAMAPLMFQKGLGADLQKPMALAIIGGMFIGTLVSLFFIPLMYYLLKRKSTMKKPKNQAIVGLISFVFFIVPFGSLAQNVPVSKKLKTEPKYTIDLYSAFKNAKTFPLSFIAEEIEYIPLEKSKDCLIGDHLTNIFFDNENIIVFDYENCYRFNRSGKFINKIGKKGHGPGEYIRPTSIAVDTNVKAVYFLDKDRVLKYNYKGEFLQEFGLDFKAMTILQYKTGIFLLDDMYYQYADPDKRFSIRIFSEKEEKQIAKVDCPKKDKIPFSISSPITYNFNQKTFLKDYWDDNIYTVEDPLNLRHYASINTGKLIHREKDDESVFTGKKNKGDELILDITYISESDRFVFLLGNKGLFTFDKISHETTCCEFKKVGEKWQNFENDLTGGPTLLPNNFPRLPVSNNTFVTFNHAYEFFEEGIDNNNPRIKALMKTLQPDDNPVLVLVKLKK